MTRDDNRSLSTHETRTESSDCDRRRDGHRRRGNGRVTRRNLDDRQNGGGEAQSKVSVFKVKKGEQK